MKINLKGNTSQEGTPTPTTPQDIHVVSGDNEINLVGKNLFNGETELGTFNNSTGEKTTSTNTRRSVNKILVKPSTQYIFSRDSVSFAIRVYYYQKNGTYISTEANSNGIFTTPSNAYYVNFISDRILSNYNDIQLEQGNQATTYEPYQSQSYPISLGVENLWNLSTTYENTTSSNKWVLNDTDVSFPPGIYTFSCNNTNTTSNSAMINFKDSNNNEQTISLTTSKTITFTNEKVKVAIRLNANTTISNIQLEKGSKQNSFTPYGTTPIELCKIGNYQDSIKKSTGKNLFDKNNANILNAYLNVDNGKITNSNPNRTLYIPCNSNTTYTLTKYASPYIRQIGYTTELPANNVDFYGKVDIPANETTGTITTGENAKYLVCRIMHTNQDTITQQQMLDSIQIEKGNTSTPYEPYGKVWYLNKQIGKAVLNGSETITSNPNGTNSYFIDVYGVNKISSVINTICNYFRGINYNDRAVRGDNVIYGEINQNKITIRNTTYTSIELFTTFLSTYKPTVYYVLATPTYTEITDSTLLSQLNALAKSYTSQTNISQNNNDLASVLNATALEEM